MDVRLPSGVLMKGIPDGTTKDEIKAKAIKAGLATEADFGAPAQSFEQQLKPDAAPAAQIVEKPGIVSDVAENTLMGAIPIYGQYHTVKTLMEKKSQSDQEADAKMTELEKTNPYLAAQIKATPGWKKALISYGMGINDLARGSGLASSPTAEKVGDVLRMIPGLSMLRTTAESTQATDQPLTDTSTAASAGRIVGQAAPFIPAGLGVSSLASIPWRVAGSGALGATEGTLIARGTEQSGQEQVKGGIIGGGIGIAAESIPIVGPIIAASISRRLGKAVAPEQLVLPDGQLTPEFSQYLDSQGITPEQAIAQAQTEANTARTFAESAPRTPDDLEALNNIDIPAAMAQIDPRSVQNYVDAGIDIADIPVAAVTRNNRVRELSAQLAAIPGSETRDQALRLADAVRNTARQTIEEAGGSMQAGSFSEQTLNAMRATRETLYQSENDAYRQLGDQIDARLASLPPTSVRAPELKAELAAKAAKLRETNLSTVEQKALKLLGGKPTYHDIDNFRKEVGDSLGDIPRGVYADQAQGTLKHIYGQLQEAQNKFARGLLGNDSLRLAQSISKERNAIQDQVEFFGKNDGFGSMVSKLGQVAGGAKRVDYAQFDEVMANIPEPYRKGALSTIMNQTLKISPDEAAEKMSAGAFADMWSNIRGDSALNSRVKTILGDESYTAFDKLAGMAKGVSRALGGKQTGIAREALRDFYKPSGVIGKITKALRIGGVATGAPGAGAAATVVDGVTALANAGDSSAIGNVSMMISSPTLMRAAIEAANDPVSSNAKALSALFMKTKVANDFMEAATADARKQIIAAGGIPLWLMTSQKEEEKQ